jgi:hypothetical protein
VTVKELETIESAPIPDARGIDLLAILMGLVHDAFKQ